MKMINDLLESYSYFHISLKATDPPTTPKRWHFMVATLTTSSSVFYPAPTTPSHVWRADAPSDTSLSLARAGEIKRGVNGSGGGGGGAKEASSDARGSGRDGGGGGGGGGGPHGAALICFPTGIGTSTLQVASQLHAWNVSCGVVLRRYCIVLNHRSLSYGG